MAMASESGPSMAVVSPTTMALEAPVPLAARSRIANRFTATRTGRAGPVGWPTATRRTLFLFFGRGRFLRFEANGRPVIVGLVARIEAHRTFLLLSLDRWNGQRGG
jgi:hypothetical protein